MAISVRDVTDVDRRTARRLGMDADRVNLVINVWAEEYLAVEKVSRRLSDAANPGQPVPPSVPPTLPKPAIPEPANPGKTPGARKRTPRKTATGEGHDGE